MMDLYQGFIISSLLVYAMIHGCLCITRVTHDTDPSIPKIGDTKTLRCAFESFPDNRYRVTWYKDKNILDIDSADQYSVSGSFHALLHISDIDRSIAGQYTCEYGSEESGPPYMLNVRYAASKPQVLPGEVTIAAGSHVELLCVQSDPGYPPPERYGWIKDNFLRLEDTIENKLTIESASALDWGTYQCYSKTGTSQSPKSQPARIIIEAKSIIESTSAVLEEHQNSVHIRATCDITGTNITEVSWYKNGEKLINGSDIKIYPLKEISGDFSHDQDTAWQSKLVINIAVINYKSIQPYEGTLHCDATGVTGQKVHHVESKQIELKYGPLWSGDSDDQNFVIKNGHDLTMKCLVKANPPVDIRDIRWNHRRGQMPEGSRVYNDTAKLHDVTKEHHSGLYTCSVRNQLIKTGPPSYKQFKIDVKVMVTSTGSQWPPMIPIIIGVAAAILIILLFFTLICICRTKKPDKGKGRPPGQTVAEAVLENPYDDLAVYAEIMDNQMNETDGYMTPVTVLLTNNNTPNTSC